MTNRKGWGRRAALTAGPAASRGMYGLQAIAGEPPAPALEIKSNELAQHNQDTVKL